VIGQRILKAASVLVDKADRQEVIDRVAQALQGEPEVLYANTLHGLGELLANFERLPENEKAHILGGENR